MKNVFTSLLSLALLATAPLASQASGFGSEGVSLGIAGPRHLASTKAGDGPFGVGTNVVNLGIGFGSSYAYGGNVSASPAFSVSYERGVKEIGPGVLGIGILGGYQSSSIDLFGFKQTSTDILVAIRGAFHYPVSDKFDAYGGVGIGFRKISYKADDSSGSGFGTLLSIDYSGIYSALFVGGRYFFTESIGAFAELGYDQTYLKAGVAFKF